MLSIRLTHQNDIFNPSFYTPLFPDISKREYPIKRMDKIPNIDSFYIACLAFFDKITITPDFVIYNHSSAIHANRYLNQHYPMISKKYWIIGDTGQGDEWLIHKDTQHIYFYDHNQGEYLSFLNMEINFFDFLQLAFLCHDLAYYLENMQYHQTDIYHNIDSLASNFTALVNQIKTGLFALLPIDFLAN